MFSCVPRSSSPGSTGSWESPFKGSCQHWALDETLQDEDTGVVSFLALFFTSHALFLARQALQPACSSLSAPNETTLTTEEAQICSYTLAVPWADTTKSWFRSRFCWCKGMLRGVTAFTLTGECLSIKHVVSNLLGQMPKVKTHSNFTCSKGFAGCLMPSQVLLRKTWKYGHGPSSHHSKLWDLLRNCDKKCTKYVTALFIYLLTLNCMDFGLSKAFS